MQPLVAEGQGGKVASVDRADHDLHVGHIYVTMTRIAAAVDQTWLLRRGARK